MLGGGVLPAQICLVIFQQVIVTKKGRERDIFQVKTVYIKS